MPRPSFQTAPATQRAAEALSHLRPGEMLTWAQLSEIVGQSAQVEGRPFIDSARRILLREKKMVLEVVTNVGLQHVEAGDKPGVAQATCRKINRAARRAIRKLDTVHDLDQWEDMTPEQQRKWTLMAGAMGHLSRDSNSSHLRAEARRAANSEPHYRPACTLPVPAAGITPTAGTETAAPVVTANQARIDALKAELALLSS